MKISLLSIAKKEKSRYDPLYKEIEKMISRFSSLEDIELFPKEVTKAHTISPDAAQAAYAKVYEPHLRGSYNIVLDPKGKKLDSFEFSKLLSDKMAVKFFIGGAYGFNQDFISRCDKVISLSDLTFSHKIAKAVLLEQIYRGFSILSNHPYHK